ncbi:uncharacterized protein LOC116874538 [Lontra canadensis]|uniref:uncharacterized protein LOC116874538 n=1 Tax=Lontra canadensis TaxID=76717 RepID=UPI0013F2BF24|nr:uncharacterized protein LOC116874538 [Lontra canadensis]
MTALPLPRPPTSQSVTTSRKENKPAETHPSTCSGRPKAARSPRVTGGGARTLEAAGGLGCGRRARSPGDQGPLVSAPPLPLPEHRSPPSRPGWGRGRQWLRALGRCLGAKGSALVSQQSLFVTEIRLEAKAAGQPGQGPERRRGCRRWEESARGEGDRRQGPRRLDLLVSQLRRRGAEEPVLPKTKPKMGNGEARAALRGMKIQATGLDGDLLRSISGRRPDHVGIAKSQANSSATRGILRHNQLQ